MHTTATGLAWVSNNPFPASPPAYFLSLRLFDTPPSAGLPASPAPQPHGCQGIYCYFFQSAKVLHTFYLHILYCFEPRVEVTCVRLTCGALRHMMPRAPMNGPRLQHTASRWCRARASDASDMHVGACVHPFIWCLCRRCALPQRRATPRPCQIVHARKRNTVRDPHTDPLPSGAAAPYTRVVSLRADHKGDHALHEVDNTVTEGVTVCYDIDSCG